MILLAVTGWTVALACAVTFGVVLAIIYEQDCSGSERGGGAVVAAIPPLIVFAVYGIACWFGGHS